MRQQNLRRGGAGEVIVGLVSQGGVGPLQRGPGRQDERGNRPRRLAQGLKQGRGLGIGGVEIQEQEITAAGAPQRLRAGGHSGAGMAGRLEQARERAAGVGVGVQD